MELDRRNFIKFIVGGAGGTLLSPLPWKLIDDISIWTQNWSWVPVPARGKVSYVDTVCTLCPGACGITVKKVGDRAVKIEARDDYPLSRGGICPLGMAGQQILYNEGVRWKAPMKRTGPRGSNRWGEISWDEAIDLLAVRVRALRDGGTPERFAALDGNQPRSTVSSLIKRLLDSVGSPHYLTMPGQEDTFSTVELVMQGHRGPVGLDLENSDCILSFGCGLLDGWLAPGRMLSAWGEWAARAPHQRTYVVQIEPRASHTASKADLWLAPYPGTEAALALGIAHVLIKEHSYDREFTTDHALGFTDWIDDKGRNHKGFSEVVRDKYSPEKVEGITGVKRDLIVEVARRFARAKAPLALSGRGKGLLPGGMYETMAVHALNALRGRINQKGGVLTPEDLPLAQWHEVEYDSVAINGLKRQRVDRAGTPRYPFAGSLIQGLSEAIKASPDPLIDTLVICSANPVQTMPDSQGFVEAMQSIPFIVSLSPFKDETSLMADLILPDHTHLEKMADLVWPAGVQYPFYALSRPAAKPLYRTRHSGDVIITTAKRIGGAVAWSFGWADFEEALKERVMGLYDAGRGEASSREAEPAWRRLDRGEGTRPAYASFESMWEDLTNTGCWYIPSHSYGRWSEIFGTPSGKFEFFSTAVEGAIQAYAGGRPMDEVLEELGIRSRGDEVCMPHYEEIRSGDDEDEYPLLLYPVELINLASGWIGNPPFLNKTLFDHQLKGNDLFVEMNPGTASRYGLNEGARVILRSRRGQARVRIHLFDGAMPGAVFMPVGLGHNGYDRHLKGKGENPYRIVARVEDPLSGQPVWWNTRVKVMKI
jgi:anaerobic selenocysteine-containing dehydrogenase